MIVWFAQPENPTEGQGEGSVNMRLPDHVTPLHYEVELQPHMYSGKPEEFSYDGERERW